VKLKTLRDTLIVVALGRVVENIERGGCKSLGTNSGIGIYDVAGFCGGSYGRLGSNSTGPR
jgi:hypothetical protein